MLSSLLWPLTPFTIAARGWDVFITTIIAARWFTHPSRVYISNPTTGDNVLGGRRYSALLYVMEVRATAIIV